MDYIRQNSLVINSIKNRQSRAINVSDEDLFSEENIRRRNFFMRKYQLKETDSDYFDSSDEERQEIVGIINRIFLLNLIYRLIFFIKAPIYYF